MTNYIPEHQISDLLNSSSENDQNTYKSSIEVSLENEGVVIISGESPKFDSSGYIINVSPLYPYHKTKSDFITWLDSALCSYWIPIREEEGVAVLGPFNLKNALAKQQNQIDTNNKAGKPFYSASKEIAIEKAPLYFTSL